MMTSEPPFMEAKIVLLGETGVGKTSIVSRYVLQKFVPSQNPTIGASFLTKTLYLNETRLKLQLWDTAGQERFRSLAPMYYRGASAALLVYDVTYEDSYNKVKDWVRELRTNIYEDIILVVVNNQKDKAGRKIKSETAKEYAASIGALCFDTSAKLNEGIEEMFLEVAKKLVKTGASNVQVSKPELSSNPNEERSRACCKWG